MIERVAGKTAAEKTHQSRLAHSRMTGDLFQTNRLLKIPVHEILCAQKFFRICKAFRMKNF